MIIDRFPDYAFETPDAIDDEIAKLEERVRDARAEADHARGVAGLDGPARAADAEAESLLGDIATLREIRERIVAGFPYWQRFGFETALDAVGEASHWQPLAEILAPTLTLGEEADVRVPLDAQRAYARAVASGLFGRFEICSALETDGDDVLGTTHYLFGTSGGEERPDALFFVGQW